MKFLSICSSKYSYQQCQFRFQFLNYMCVKAMVLICVQIFALFQYCHYVTHHMRRHRNMNDQDDKILDDA
jgi:hypothetical protein